MEQIGLVPISENTLKKQGGNKSYLCILTYRAFISYSFFSLFCGSIGSHFSVVLQMMDLVRLFCCFLSHQLVPLIDRLVTQFIMASLLKRAGYQKLHIHCEHYRIMNGKQFCFKEKVN